MKWLSVLGQMLFPVGVAIYTFNFGRWMSSRKIKSGAFGAYLMAALSLGLAVFVLIRHNL